MTERDSTEHPDGGREETDFLTRWSRRKRAAARGESGDDSGREPRGSEHAEAAPAEEPASPAPDEDILAASAKREAESAGGEELPPGDEDMPPLETVERGGSVAPFFSPRVSESLRRAALRRMFAQPRFNVVDELDDYAGDYRRFTPLGSLVTNEMRRRIELAKKRMAEKLERQLDPEQTGPDAGRRDPPAAEAPQRHVAERAPEDPAPSLDSDSSADPDGAGSEDESPRRA